MENKNYLELPQEKFEFANTGESQLTDKKLVTKKEFSVKQRKSV